MSIKEKYEQLHWEWMQSLGRSRYLRRCLSAWLLFGAMMYPFQQGTALIFGYGQPDPHYPSWSGFFWSLPGAVIGGYLYGAWMWRRYEQRHRATLTPITVA